MAFSLGKIFHPQEGWIAVGALLLGIVHASIDVCSGMRGAEPALLDPKGVLVVRDIYPSGNVFVRFALPMSYINKGPEKKRVVIIEEALRFFIGDESFEHDWQSFAHFKGAGCNLELEDDDDPTPVVLAGNDGKSHTTYFAPRSADGESVFRNFLTWDDFLLKANNADRIELEVEATTLEGRQLTKRCAIELDDIVRAHLAESCSLSVSCRPIASEGATSRDKEKRTL